MVIGIIGLGLIGGSFAKAIHARTNHTLYGADTDTNAYNHFLREGILHGACDTTQLALCDMIILALPPCDVVHYIADNATDFKPGALIIDCAGTKRTICNDVLSYAFQAPWTFIGAHPMAGREVSGYAAADCTLFEGATMLATPYPFTGRAPIDQLEAFCHAIGFARLVCVRPEEHDEMIAYTSQLAHLVSNAYIRDPLAQRHSVFSAGSFTDMTRVATLDPSLWTELFMANRDALLPVLDRFITRLSAYREAIDLNDRSALGTLLTDGRRMKLETCTAGENV